jgi:hypothetical protein
MTTSEVYRLDIGEITMQTEGGGIVHTESEAFATEKVTYYAAVVNNTDQYLGPFEVDFTVDDHDIAWGGMSHQGVPAGESVWVHGQTEHLAPGWHTLHIRVNTGDDLFQGSEQSVQLHVLEPRTRRAMHDGQESHHEGWKRRQVYLAVEDFAGEPFDQKEAYVTFSGPGGEASERGFIEGGRLTLESVWAPTTGSVTLEVLTGQQVALAHGGRISGTTNFTITEEARQPGQEMWGSPLQMSFYQIRKETKTTVGHASEHNNKIGGSAKGGLDFKIWSAEAELTYEHGWSESESESTEITIWSATPNLRAGQRSGD